MRWLWTCSEPRTAFPLCGHWCSGRMASCACAWCCVSQALVRLTEIDTGSCHPLRRCLPLQHKRQVVLPIHNDDAVHARVVSMPCPAYASCICLLYGSRLTPARPHASDCSRFIVAVPSAHGAIRVRQHNLLRPLRGLARLQSRASCFTRRSLGHESHVPCILWDGLPVPGFNIDSSLEDSFAELQLPS